MFEKKEEIEAYAVEKLGYTSANCEITLWKAVVYVVIEVEDDFQKGLSGDDRYMESAIRHYHHEKPSMATVIAALDEVFEMLRERPGRNVRELGVLARQASKNREILEALQSAQAREFAERLMEEYYPIYNLLEEAR